MKPIFVWIAAAAVIVGAWSGWGWHGVIAAVTLIAFGLMLQFNRLVRLMRRAAESPLGYVDNAVMLHARLHVGLPMAKVVALTTSLGRRLDDAGETFVWTDAAGASVAITFVKGQCASWKLTRAAESPANAVPMESPDGGDALAE